ncbi:MAG: M42 family metallopeptidase [Flavobacteriales bacterium]|jgi:putative aminopeptidase FrvX|uniref:M42 family metallopeptidase n=1 Tax=Blattabacterium sp. (Mastotermes darwiniensis) TaxID=39768 RepID=UPI000231DFA7|nr:M42 family metallopeptidase [Blattabacterium sp. (Mastotermes darwiniensis)]AER40447.1 M42 family peptidase [Blattabacterium sp. (Mastotermes darwiniensis) str. MADAR]MDR1805037.1 M42 family metallopeptidase [Flavobacteriales bacterium]
MKNKNFYSISGKSIKFIEKYLNSFSPTGYESEGQKIWKTYIGPYVEEIQTDLYGTVVGIINPNNSSYKLIIEAHADEISWYVNYITEDGIIYVSRNGGSDYQIAPSKRVVIHTEKGLVHGLFGWPAIHTRRKHSEEKKPNINNIFVDIGALDRKEVEKMGVHIGCMITYPDEFFIMNQNYFVGRSLDNKIGGFIIAEVAKMIIEHEIDLQFGLYVVNSVQEEVGLKGAKMISKSIKPHMAIVTDVTHDTSTPMIDKKIHGDIKCGLGPVIGYAPSIQKNLREFIINTANQKKISFQRLVSSMYTGTDTDAFAYSNKGVTSSLISIPLRYMHTTVEMVHKKDIENTIQLIFETLKGINSYKEKFFID